MSQFRQSHIRIWVEPDLRGPTIQFTPAERWCWVALRLLTADCPHQPFLCYDDKTGYGDYTLAKAMKVPKKVWLSTKDKLVNLEMIEVNDENIIKIGKWEKHDSGTRRLHRRAEKDPKRKLVKPLPGADMNIRENRMRHSVLIYYNQRCGRRVTMSNQRFSRLISSRIREGATLEDFYYVIDLKLKQWKGTKYERHIYPLTLFNRDNFWDFVHEAMPEKAEPEPEVSDRMELTKGEFAIVEQAQKDYNRKLEAYKQKYGVETFDELVKLNVKIPSAYEYIQRKLKQHRAERGRVADANVSKAERD